MDLWNNDTGLKLIDNVYFRLNNTPFLENMRRINMEIIVRDENAKDYRRVLVELK